MLRLKNEPPSPILYSGVAFLAPLLPVLELWLQWGILVFSEEPPTLLWRLRRSVGETKQEQQLFFAKKNSKVFQRESSSHLVSPRLKGVVVLKVSFLGESDQERRNATSSAVKKMYKGASHHGLLHNFQ